VKRAIAWFAENHVAANLLMMLVIVGGVTGIFMVQQKTFPDIEVEMIQVGVVYPGAAPEDAEEGICVRIEEEIQSIEGIERITSTATEGACGVTAELISGYPVDRALSEIKNAVDSIDTFPDEAKKPLISHVSPRRNVMQIALSGAASERTLKVLGERTRDEIAALPGVTQVEVSSARDYEISIEVPEESLRRHGLTFDQVVEAVRRGSLDLPGGSIKARGGEVLLRTKGQAYRGEEFERIVVLTRADGTRLLLSDVARVVDGFEDDDRFSHFDGEPAVLIQVYRVGEQRVLELVRTVSEYVAGASERMAEGVNLTIWRDESKTLRDRLDILIRNGRSGFILVFVVLALSLRLRLAFWVSLGVPLSFLGALWLFPMLGVSIDLISLFAFITVLGLLVDDAIVVGENVYRHQERSEQPLEASIRGTQEVAVPVIFGVLTTMAAFLPMFLAPGTMGQIYRALATVVMCCLVFSLIESQLILPAHLGHMRVKPRDSEAPETLSGWKRVQAIFATGLERLAQRGYRPALERALERLTMPQGTPVDVTADVVRELEAAALRVKRDLEVEYPDLEAPLIKHIQASVGEHPTQAGHAPPGMGGSSTGSHLGEVSVELLSGDLRPLAAKEVEQRWREATPQIAGTEELAFSSALFRVGDPIDIELQSSDVAQLREAADALKGHLAKYPGTLDVADSFRDGKEEIQLAILPAAETLGLTLEDLAHQVRQAFYGEEVQRIQRGRDDVRVMVRYPVERRRSLEDLDNLRIRTRDGGEVPFYAVARAERGRGFANINRRDRRRVIHVTADVDPERGNAGEILEDLEQGYLPRFIAERPGLGYSLEGEQREQRKSTAALLSSGLFALVLIYALLAVPLRSYGQPLIIMAVIPFGLVGAVAGHFIMNMNLSMMSVFGVVALSGVVVNSSLVLVHYINQRREDGCALDVAVREAGVARFRPIVLTSLTTFAGLMPLLAERSVTAQFLIPMATSLAFGVVFATSISLFLVPSSYMMLEDIKALVRRKRPVSAGVPAPVDAGAIRRERQGSRVATSVPAAPTSLRRSGR
jgi:multidrug efflux pump subunit AcrB